MIVLQYSIVRACRSFTENSTISKILIDALDPIQRVTRCVLQHHVLVPRIAFVWSCATVLSVCVTTVHLYLAFAAPHGRASSVACSRLVLSARALFSMRYK